MGSLLLTGTHLIHRHAVEKEYVSSECFIYPDNRAEWDFWRKRKCLFGLVFIRRCNVYFASHQHVILVKHNIKLNLIKHDYHTGFVPVNDVVIYSEKVVDIPEQILWVCVCL